MSSFCQFWLPSIVRKSLGADGFAVLFTSTIGTYNFRGRNCLLINGILIWLSIKTDFTSQPRSNLLAFPIRLCAGRQVRYGKISRL